MPAHENVVPLRVPVPVAATQGTLALELEPRTSPPAPAAATGSRLRAVPDEARRLAHQQREVERWAGRFVQAAVEIVGGDRPVSQLVRWTSRDVHLDLDRRARLVARAGGHQAGTARVQPVRPRVQSVHSCPVRDGVVEAGVHVRYGPRSRAVAARFERRQDRWVCTALDFA